MANNKDFKVKNGIQPTVYNEGVGTVVSGSEGYSLSNASYDSVSYDYAGDTSGAMLSNTDGLFFKPDGTKFWVTSQFDGKVYAFSLSTAWDLSTASYDSVNFSTTSQETEPYSTFFKSDGTKMYVVGAVNDTVYQYSLSTAWNISTASYDSVSFVPTGSNNFELFFKSDGTKMYVSDYIGGIYEYNLSTAWDISTASSSSSFDPTEETGLQTFYLTSNGSTLFVGGDTTDTIYKYTLSTPWSISTASYTNESFSVLSQDGNPRGLYFKSDGTKMYVATSSSSPYLIYQYSTAQTTASLDLSTGAVFDYTPTSDVQVTVSNPAASGTVSSATLLLSGGASTSYDLSAASYDDISFSVASQENLPYDIEFKPDGTEMYVTGTAGIDINQYTLSTAWDITTASFTQNFSYSSQDSSPYASSFKTDGTKLYMVAAGNDAVFQYSLSTAWDISTASYDSVSFSVSSQTTVPVDIAFKSDGTKMYIVSSTGTEGVYQYSLSTAWDLSTASYDSVFFNTTSQSSNLFGIEFSSDGTKMFTAGITNDDIYQYSLSTAWDLSTASYDSVELNVTAQDGGMAGITFKSDGSKMFLSGSSTDSVYQYSVASPATITYDTTLEWAGGTAPTAPAIGETDVITISTRDGGTTYQAIQAIDGAK